MVNVKCDTCGVEFRGAASLNKHISKKHPNDFVKNDLKCPYCILTFNRKFNLNRHISSQHTGRNNLPKEAAVFCENCEFGCASYVELVQHYREFHKLPMVFDKFNFSTVLEYENWKNNMETETRSQFIVRNGKKDKNGVVRRDFRCNRSGRYFSQSKGIRVLKKEGSNKFGGTCPAFLHVFYETSGSVTVQCCLTHLKHDNRLKAQTLPKSVKDKVADLLKAGVSETEIVRIFKSTSTVGTLKREHLLNKKDVQNIRRQRNIVLPQIHEQQSYSAVKNLQSQSYNDSMYACSSIGTATPSKIVKRKRTRKICSNKKLKNAKRLKRNSVSDDEFADEDGFVPNATVLENNNNPVKQEIFYNLQTIRAFVSNCKDDDLNILNSTLNQLRSIVSMYEESD